MYEDEDEDEDEDKDDDDDDDGDGDGDEDDLMCEQVQDSGQPQVCLAKPIHLGII